MVTPSIVNPRSSAAQSGKHRKPRTFAEAIAEGFEIIEEHLYGASELNRRGHFMLERIGRATGDAERITVPFTGKITAGRVRSYRVDRHAFLTPEETAVFLARAAKAVRG